MKKRILCLPSVLCALALTAPAQVDLAEGFAAPPPSARPWVYWFPLDGNITRRGITADLEAMARVGIGGVLCMETAQGTPKGDAPFASDKWWALIQHACNEAARLGLEINMNNDAGWCGSGGPWITPEQSMQRVVWTETSVTGPVRFDKKLPQPRAVQNYYRDIALFAFPPPPAAFRLPQLRGKTAAVRQEIPLRAAFPTLPADAVTSREKVIDLTGKLTAEGRLVWDVPEGEWTLLRMGHTSTGKDNHPAPIDGRGLECDKLNPAALDTHFDHLMGKLAKENRLLTGPGKTFIRTHIDSWETHSQNWTPRFREEFRRLRGYDPQPLLPVMAGRVIDSAEVSERFLWDVRQTICELLLEHYVGHMRERAHGAGLSLSIEAYGDGPFDNLAYAGQADEPMSEFWSWSRFGAAGSCIQMSSAAHIYGKPVHGAEAFTATDGEKWQGHPGNIKDIGDWAFCAGVNRFVFHRYALQPWEDVRPGISMGPWGLHYERTQTWWEQSGAWHAYLARCQYLLQQGLCVADACFLMPENAPQSFHSPVKRGYERPGYSFDGCPPDAALTRLSVEDGRIVLPDGMGYRLLVLPRTPAMTPRLLRKVRDLVAAGATVLGNPPLRAPGLAGYPQADAEVRALAQEIWGGGEPPAELTGRAIGKGKVIWGRELMPSPDPDYAPDFALTKAKWIWFNEGRPAQSAPPGTRYFRRVVTLDANAKVTSARLAMTADNEFQCWVNGRMAGRGDRYERMYVMNVRNLLKPGPNTITVAAVNITDAPSPAGLIAALMVRLADTSRLDVVSDGAWQAARKVADGWQTSSSAAGWTAALELGPPGMGPWGEIEEGHSGGNTDMTPDIGIASRVLDRMGVVPDFAATSAGQPAGLRYIHKRIGNTEAYFVANRDDLCHDVVCSFRVEGKRPELWWPDTGRTAPVAGFQVADGRTHVPLRLAPFASVFVVFRHPLGAFDPVVALSRDGAPVLPEPQAAADISVRTALYGLLDDASATLDVTEKVRALFAAGRHSFAVTEMAKPVDPAYGVVKTLKVDCVVDGKPLTLSCRDGQTVTVVPPASDFVARVQCGQDGGLMLHAGQPGHYVLKIASGRTVPIDIPAFPQSQVLTGPWELAFPPNAGAPAHVTLPKLISWSEHPAEGVKHFSGTATYSKSFEVSETMLGKDRRASLDLGEVAVMAEATLNGHAFGTLWKRPFELDVTKAIRVGENRLEVKVVNLWINRMIGDEQLADDSPRKRDGRTLDKWPDWLLAGKPSPTGRFTFTSHRLWKRNDLLVPSGLLGPVKLRVTTCVAIPE